MIKMVLCSALSTTHCPKTSIGVVIALEQRHQFRFAARRTRELMESDAKSHDRFIVACHEARPSSILPHSSLKRV